MANNRMKLGVTEVRAEDVWMCGGIITVGLALMETVVVNSVLRGNIIMPSFCKRHRPRVEPTPGPSTSWAEDEETVDTSSPETADKIDFFSRILFPISFTVFVIGYLLHYVG
ncbi:uncharacterized protein LOC118409871 [Branchiostoma floridae]|uniref:Uncharacterized protein LOC118409871 n=1 Tax=Branchiostoma floridae TaxID=7739 RepID=A0A9J7KNB8_BRAFL|nr:uncharacterized protein LOC118409871 [Branchiostoma floridae]